MFRLETSIMESLLKRLYGHLHSKDLSRTHLLYRNKNTLQEQDQEHYIADIHQDLNELAKDKTTNLRNKNRINQWIMHKILNNLETFPLCCRSIDEWPRKQSSAGNRIHIFLHKEVKNRVDNCG